MDALFRPDGPDRFIPSDVTRGPWAETAMHGGPPAALLATLLAQAGDPGDQRVTRLAVELLRPVPVEPLTTTVVVTRPGRKVSFVEASLADAGGTVVARASAWRIRTQDVELPATAAGTALPAPGPAGEGAGPRRWSRATWTPAFVTDGVEIRFVAGQFDQLGPSTAWFRLLVDVIEGQPPTPLARAVAVADFGNGISASLPAAEGWSFVNPDLTVALHRHPAGEWVCVDAATVHSDTGIGLTRTVLHDGQGEIGRALQTLVVEPPPAG